MCEGGKEAEACSMDDPCTPGSYFCDCSSAEDVETNVSGTCRACPLDIINECFRKGFVSSHQSKINCHDCRMNCYNAMGQATVNHRLLGGILRVRRLGVFDSKIISRRHETVHQLLQSAVGTGSGLPRGTRSLVRFFNREETEGRVINAKPLWDASPWSSTTCGSPSITKHCTYSL